MDLMDLVEGTTTSLDNKKTTIGVFIKPTNAFDTINHDLILKKLFHYRVRGIGFSR